LAGRLPYERGMTLPRSVEPGKTYLVTRRCILRSFLLTPCDEVNQLLLYAIGLYAPQFGIALHAVTALGSHWHLVCTDVLGVLPDFFQCLHSTIARAMNVFRERSGAFWEATQYGRVELLDEGTVLDKMVYVAANPVAAGLVALGHEWPGIRLLPDESGSRVIRATKPKFYFRKDDGLPDVVEFEIVRPRVHEELDNSEFASRLDAECEHRELELRCDARDEGRSFLGAARVKAQDPFATPKTRDPVGGTTPRFASRNPNLLRRAKEDYKSWVACYCDALERFNGLEREAEFPRGTWKMRVFHNVNCASEPP